MSIPIFGRIVLRRSPNFNKFTRFYSHPYFFFCVYHLVFLSQGQTFNLGMYVPNCSFLSLNLLPLLNNSVLMDEALQKLILDNYLTAKEYCTVSLVCKQWSSLARSSLYWRVRIQRDYPKGILLFHPLLCLRFPSSLFRYLFCVRAALYWHTSIPEGISFTFAFQLPLLSYHFQC